MKKTINIEAKLQEQAKKAAKKKGQTLEGYVTDAIQKLLAHDRVVAGTRSGLKVVEHG